MQKRSPKLEMSVTRRTECGDALRADLEHLSAIIAAQYDIMTAERDLDTVMTLIAERTQALTDADGVAIELADGDEMVYHVASGTVTPYVGMQLRSAAILAGHSVRRGKTLRCDDTQTDPRVDRLACQRLDLRSMIVVPLQSGYTVMGTLIVLSHRVNRFDDRDMQTLSLMAGLITAALGHAARFEAKQALVAERTAALDYQTLHDALTGLPNRVLLRDRLGQAALGAQRNGTAMALLLIDLDRFKDVNDTFGHRYGDLLLQQVARRLQGVLRPSETVARLGGDEFAALLPIVADVADATQTAHELLTALDQPVVVEGHSFDVGASIGVALCPDHGRDEQTLLRRADIAMYVAKHNRGGYAVYDAEQDHHSPDRLALMGELRQAIEQGRLVMHYQPQVDVVTHEVCGVEALVRWPHPRHGLMLPHAFIPLAEHTGLIKPLSMWILDAALTQYEVWARAGLALTMAINLSTRNLQDAQMIDHIARSLSVHHVPATALTVEITESAIMADPAYARKILTRLSALGVRLSIDDFGTGYSSLAYLKRLPMDELKIDKSFLLDAATDSNNGVIVRSIISLGHNLGLTVVAEGVENVQAWQALTDLHCDVAQGYYLGRPVPAADLTQSLISDQKALG